MQKSCRDCGVEKPLAHFYKHGAMPDGYLNKCKDCVKSRVNKHRADNIDKVRAYDRKRGSFPHRVEARVEYAKTEQGRIAIRRGKDKWEKANPVKRKAQQLIATEVRAGRFTRQPCAVCDRPNTHGHHPDYSKPLDVIWVCPRHHSMTHKLERLKERLETVK